MQVRLNRAWGRDQAQISPAVTPPRTTRAEVIAIGTASLLILITSPFRIVLRTEHLSYRTYATDSLTMAVLASYQLTPVLNR